MLAMRAVKTGLLRKMAGRLISENYGGMSAFLVAVSGGVDSMVLLDMLFRLRNLHKAKLKIIYFNHQSGNFSALCEDLIGQFCLKRNLAFVSEIVPHQNGNFEFLASEFRRKRLLALLGPKEIACLGHHRRDLAETALLSILRGKGAQGTLGFQEFTGAICRPFWDTSRELIYEHACKAEVPHLIDPTNLSSQQFRGSLRSLFQTTALQSYGGGEGAMCHWVKSSEQQHTFLQFQALELFRQYFRCNMLSRDAFSLQNQALWPFLLQTFLESSSICTLGYRAQQQIFGWILDDQFNFLDAGNQLIWVDLDGLAVTPKYAFKEQKLENSKSCSWGPWMFSLSNPAKREAAEPFVLQKCEKTPESIKELYRIIKLPHRLRRWIPQVMIGQKVYHPLSLIEKGPGEIVWEWRQDATFSCDWLSELKRRAQELFP